MDAKTDVFHGKLNIRIRDQTGEETLFKVKPTTKLDTVFNAFSTCKGIAVTSLRFLFDGSPVRGDQTSADIGIEDGDRLVVELHLPPAETPPETVTVDRTRDDNEHKPTTPTQQAEPEPATKPDSPERESLPDADPDSERTEPEP